jgi:hypothetical protein
MRKMVSIGVLVFALVVSEQALAGGIDWNAVDKDLGKTGAAQGDIHRYGYPRSDLHVSVDGVVIKPALALGGWLAFEPAKDGAMVMGDLVLTDSEIEPVMSKLLESGIEVTALHTHLLRAEPPVYYMHVMGHGDPVALAAALRAGVAESATPLTAGAPAQNAPIDLDTGAIERALGLKGKASGGVYHFTVPRSEFITADGAAVPPAMGTGTAINFQPTGGGKAAITGDFVVSAGEVNPLIRALRENNIEVTAIHTHMLTEQPRLFFVHFWANDDAVRLARGLRAGLDRMNVARG